ncbi:MAG: diguanylate cyclase [Clostridia bacterium]|nr:diguanylate cyclase [Clostridia bacterium]
MKILFSLYLILAVILTQFLAAYCFSKGRNSYRRTFSALVLCISVYLIGYIMIINSSNLQEMIFWNQFQYLGLPFVSVLWLLVALLHTKTINKVRSRTVILLFIVPVITFFIRITNSWHHLFYKDWEIRQFFGYYDLYMERGIWYYVHISFVILFLLLTMIIYFLAYLKHKDRYTKFHFLIFSFASLLPLAGVLLLILNSRERSIDYAALIMPISLFIISFGIFKYDFLEMRTLARETIFENNLVGMIILGPGYRIIDYNNAAKKFFRKLNISLDNSTIDHILKEEPELLETFKSETTKDISIVIDGEERFFEIDAVALGDIQVGSTKMLKTIRDVTDEKKVQKRLEVLATIDSLSGLYNRAEFMNLAQRAFVSAKKQNGELALLMMDLDQFKKINDTFGHAAGDEVIREMGRIIMNGFRKTDVAGRVGGEEFAVVLKNTSLKEAHKKAEKIRKTVAGKKVVYDGQEISFTISIGVAAICGDTDNIKGIEDILKKADEALYMAKAKGRNRVVSFGSVKEEKTVPTQLGQNTN